MANALKAAFQNFISCFGKKEKAIENAEPLPTCTPLGKKTVILTKNTLAKTLDFKALFQKGESLSKGGFGEVRKLQTSVDGQHITVLKQMKLWNHEFKEMFLSEAHYQHLLNDSGVTPKIIACGFNDEVAFIAQEYIDGTTLSDERAKNALSRLPPSKKFSTFMFVFKAIAMIAQLNFVHNDITPNNILMTYHKLDYLATQTAEQIAEVPKQLYLIDFGFALPADSSQQSISGCLYYRSDNKVSKKNSKSMDDVYAMALTMAVTLSSKQEIFDNIKKSCFEVVMEKECKSKLLERAVNVFNKAGFGQFEKSTNDLSQMNLTTLLGSIIEYNTFKDSFEEVMAALKRLEERMNEKLDEAFPAQIKAKDPIIEKANPLKKSTGEINAMQFIV